ncbi:hypothetical protein KA107_02300 [Candidatus Pacearchaeota archaeon]|nr:hypothetical protein [Candidatus Pacearchaeota archaeon]
MAKFPRSYHLADIPKGELGSASKIYEECQELKDSLKQNNPIMALNELADLYGTIDLFLHRQFPGLSMKDLATMSDATKRAFNSGRRK